MRLNPPLKQRSFLNLPACKTTTRCTQRKKKFYVNAVCFLVPRLLKYDSHRGETARIARQLRKAIMMRSRNFSWKIWLTAGLLALTPLSLVYAQGAAGSGAAGSGGATGGVTSGNRPAGSTAPSGGANAGTTSGTHAGSSVPGNTASPNNMTSGNNPATGTSTTDTETQRRQRIESETNR